MSGKDAFGGTRCSKTLDAGQQPHPAIDPRHKLSRRIIAIVFCLVMTWAHAGSGEDLKSGQWFTRVGLTPAFVLPKNPFETTQTPADEHTRWISNITFEVGRQTDGSRDWHHLYGLPTYGFGFSVASFGDGDETGRPLDAYTFFSWPFARLSKRVQVTTDFGMGVSWNWKEFSEESKDYRTVLGSNVNARIDWGFYLRHLTTRKMSVYGGIDFTHRSNGGMRQPNSGINVIGPSVALRYDFVPERTAPVRHVPPFQPAWEFVMGSAIGGKNVIEHTNPVVRRDYGAARVHGRITATLLSIRQGRRRDRSDLRRGSRGESRHHRRQPCAVAARDRATVGDRTLWRVRARHRAVRRSRAGRIRRCARFRRSDEAAVLYAVWLAILRQRPLLGPLCHSLD